MELVNPKSAFVWSEPLDIHGVAMRGISEKQGWSFSRHGWLAAKEDASLNADAIGRAVRRQLRPLSAPTLARTREEYASKDVIGWPRYSILEPTGFCNKACPFCSIHAIRRLDENGKAGGLMLQWADYLKFMQEAGGHDVYGCSLYTFGEPMLWRGKDSDGNRLDIRHMVDAAKRTGGYRAVNISTNGDVDNLDLLLECDLDDLLISIDGITAEVYLANRPSTKKDDPDAFERTMARVNEFLVKKAARGQSRPFIRLQCINKENTAGQMLEFIRTWISTPGVDDVFCKNLDGMVSWVGYAAVSQAEHEQKMAKVGAMPCQHLWSIAAMSATGQFLACCHDARSELWERMPDGRVPNIRTTTFAEWWSGPFMNKLRGEHMAGDFRMPCKTCAERDPWL